MIYCNKKAAECGTSFTQGHCPRASHNGERSAEKLVNMIRSCMYSRSLVHHVA